MTYESVFLSPPFQISLSLYRSIPLNIYINYNPIIFPLFKTQSRAPRRPHALPTSPPVSDLSFSSL